MLQQYLVDPAKIVQGVRPVTLRVVNARATVLNHMVQYETVVTTKKIGRVRRCQLGPRRMEEEMAWLERYRQLWDQRFDELDRVVEELTRKEKSGERENGR